MNYKLSQIAIGLFVVNNTAFDLINISNSTRLSIMYFAIMYLCFMLICLDEALKVNKLFSFSSVMGMAFTVRILWELSKWNLIFNDYIVSVNNYEKGLLFAFLTISLILIPITNDRKFRGNRNNDK